MCSEGSLPSATAELEAAVKKHQELNEEISANYTQVHACLCSQILCVLDSCLSHCLSTPVLLQVSESGKALLDVLQRCPASDSDESVPKPDFTAATHSIMGVLHQVMQVCPSVTRLTSSTSNVQTARYVE